MSDDFFVESNKAESSWWKSEKIGDKIKGTLLSRSLKPAIDAFPEQWVYELRADEILINGAPQPVGVWNCGFSINKNYIHNRMKNIKNGQIVGFFFKSEIPSKTKGYSAAKSIEVYAGDMDPDYKEIDDLKKMEEDFNDADPFEKD